MSRKRVIITLPADAYQRLAQLADQEERVIDQQASLLLKRLLVDSGMPVSGAVAQRADGLENKVVDICESSTTGQHIGRLS